MLRPTGSSTAVPLRMGSMALLAWALASWIWAAPAQAQEAIEDNEYNVDLFTGPVLGSQRVVAMGGAFTAAAASIDGVPWNPASYGLRTHWEPEWFEWDVTFGLMLPGSMGRTDFFNNGKGEGLGTDDYLFLDTGLRLQFGYLGLGALFNYNAFSLDTRFGEANIETFSLRYGGAWMFMDGQMVVGFGGRTCGFIVDVPGDDEDPVRFGGDVDELTSLEAGVVFKPERLPLRVGLALRSRVKSTQVSDSEEQEVEQLGPYVLPRTVQIPWDIQVGVSWQFGDRPYNIKWHRPHDPAIEMKRELKERWCAREREQALREVLEEGGDPESVHPCPRIRRRARSEKWWEEEEVRREEDEDRMKEALEARREEVSAELRRQYAAMERFYWLVSLDVQVIGDTVEAVGLDAFMDQERRAYAEKPVVMVRLGSEVEPVSNRLKLRAGSYLEPARYANVDPRVHGTAGLDVRLFTWDLFGLLDEFSIRAGAMVDLSRGYVNWGAGVGTWH